MLSKLIAPIAVLAGFGYCVWGQSQGALTARELFFVPAEVVAQKNPAAIRNKSVRKSKQAGDRPVVAPKEIRTNSEVKLVTADYSGPRPLGLRYSLLKIVNRQFRPVSVDSVFRSGDAIKVRVESNEDGYLYVYSRQSDGKWVVLFPRRDIRDGSNAITGGELYDLPSPGQQWTIVDQKGEERLYIVLSRKPLSDLEMPRDAARPMDDRRVVQLQAKLVTRDLILEKVDEPKDSAGAEEQDQAAAYVVNKSGLLDATVTADIRLRHE